MTTINTKKYSWNLTPYPNHQHILLKNCRHFVSVNNLNEKWITLTTEPWPGNITVGLRFNIKCNEFKYWLKFSNTVVPSPRTQSAENNELSSSKVIITWSAVWPGVWWIL